MAIPLIIFLAILAIIILIIALFASLSLFGQVSLTLDSNGESTRLFASVCGIRFYILGKKKDKKVKLSHYTPAKIERRKKKELKKAAKKKRKAALKAAAKKKETTEGTETAKLGIKDNIGLVLTLLKKLVSIFRTKLHIKLARLNITVSGKDAASTAIMYGVISQTAGYIIEFLNNTENFKMTNEEQVSVTADFLGKKTKVDIKISIRLGIKNLLSLAILFFTERSSRLSKVKQAVSAVASPQNSKEKSKTTIK